MIRLLSYVTTALVAFGVSSAYARNKSWDQENETRGNYTEPKPWVEEGAALPAYPDAAHLLSVPVQIPGSDLEMFIDESTLAIGEDGVVRYVLVLRSPSGAENTSFEGIRCTTQELRRYAYGSSQSQWYPLDTGWESIRDEGVMRYRKRLFQYYMCRPPMGALPRREILQRMRYGLPRDLMQ